MFRKWLNAMLFIKTEKPHPHQHDYDMIFDPAASGFAYKLTCQCGDTATDMNDALRKMGLI